MDFAAKAWLSGAMQYRIDMSRSRHGYARVNLPGRVLAIEANRHVGAVWLVGICDAAGTAPHSATGSVTVRASSAGEAVWRVARAAVRAVAEITDSPYQGAIGSSLQN
ncbi:MAG: hypothetical protein AB7H71_18610 [Alphaproteobacteria bacterium]